MNYELKITKNEVLNKYGEYGVPYEVAKKMDCFKIVWNIPYEEAKKIIKDFLSNGLDSSEFYELDAICVMEFGSLGIEFMSYGENEEGKFDSGFFCCIQNEIQTFPNGYNNSVDNGWESSDFTDLIFSIDLLEDKNKFEKEMYNSMIDYAKKNDFTWSKRN